jgi:acyl-CoA hydrolase
VQFVKPTPLGPALELRARATEVGARKVTVEVTLTADGVITARGSVIAVRMTESMRAAQSAKR